MLGFLYTKKQGRYSLPIFTGCYIRMTLLQVLGQLRRGNGDVVTQPAGNSDGGWFFKDVLKVSGIQEFLGRQQRRQFGDTTTTAAAFCCRYVCKMLLKL